MKTTLVVGASGATGQLLVGQLLQRGHSVRAIVRSADALRHLAASHDRLSLIRASVMDLSDTDMAQYVKGCDAVASCLGHNLTWQGVFGQPRRLVTDTVRRLCAAVRANRAPGPTRFVLMNTTASSNRDLHEPLSIAHKCVIGILRLLLPPHVDNEAAADFLRTGIGPDDDAIEWVAVRPDTLIDADRVGEYEVHASPTRSAIFNAGKTSRINVGHFIAELISDDATWNRWRGQMPVVYDRPPA